ncbi:hypothetical protein GCM10010404_61590 [Nonomuraea africana]
MIGVLRQDVSQVPLTDDQDPVQAFAADATNPPLGNRVRTWRPHRCRDDAYSDRGEDRVEHRRELRIPIPDQDPRLDGPFL